MIKLIIDACQGKFSWKDLNSYGGMPSSHAAFVISLAATMGYFQGLNSPAFAISIIMAIIIIRDAVGLRQEVGKHAQIINLNITQLSAKKNYNLELLQERIGHTWLEILGGAIIGLIIPLIYIIFFI